MFQVLFFKHAISLACVLLWVEAQGMAIATSGFVNHSEGNEIVPLDTCDQCLKSQPVNMPTGTQTQDHKGNPNFKFTFNGIAVDVRLIRFSMDSNDDDWTTNASVSYLLDQEELHTPMEQAECHGVQCSCPELNFRVQGLRNGEHTLVLMGETLSKLNISIGCLLYKEYPYRSPNEEVPSASTAMSSRTNVNETSATFIALPNAGNITFIPKLPGSASSRPNTAPTGSSAPSTTMGPMVGVIVAGVMLFTLSIVVGVLWFFRFRNSRKNKPISTAPVLEDLYPSLALPSHTITSSMADQVDPPGYTEKNAYFGITSLLANHITLSPSASEKGPALL